MHSNKEVNAVSPIISTILLIGICTVFASVMFVWVSGFVLQSGFVPAGEMAIMERNNTTSNVTYYIRIEVLRPGTAPQDIKCYITDSSSITKAIFDFPKKDERKSISVSLSSATNGNITWYDDNRNSMVSNDDYIVLIIDAATVGDRELLRTYSFCLRYNPTGGNLIAAVGLI